MAERLLANIVIFARVLRASGVRVRAGGVPDAVRALAHIGISNRRDVRDVLRAVLVSRQDDLTAFERVFDRFWRVWREPAGAGMPRPMEAGRSRTTLTILAPGAGPAAPEQADAATTDAPVTIRTYSDSDVWRRKDFATFTPGDFARAQVALARLAWNPGVRVTRRWVPGGGTAVDLRRVVRANMKHGGELVAMPHRVRRVAPRPLILICDISGSMEPYTRMLLLFAHALGHARRRLEVFVFSTRLTRVTRQLSGVRADLAMRRIRDAVGDWAGGTRIGAALHRFNADWARRVMRRGPIVLVISDGWDLGDPDLVGREVARLQRGAHRLIWLNPLIGSPGYEPLTRGMRAALPFVDDFLPVRDMSSVEALMATLTSLP